MGCILSCGAIYSREHMTACSILMEGRMAWAGRTLPVPLYDHSLCWAGATGTLSCVFPSTSASGTFLFHTISYLSRDTKTHVSPPLLGAFVPKDMTAGMGDMGGTLPLPGQRKTTGTWKWDTCLPRPRHPWAGSVQAGWLPLG